VGPKPRAHPPFIAVVLDKINRAVDRAERKADRGQRFAASVTLWVLAAKLRGDEFDDVQDAVRDLAGALFYKHR
jgi:hypothetical protein